MVTAEFLRTLGLFVRPAFLDKERCRDLRREMASASTEPGRIVGDDHPEVSEATRRVQIARVSAETQSGMKTGLTTLLPDLQSHFNTALVECEAPRFLIYGAGGHYAPHQDTGSDLPPAMRRRIVSTVLFLNAPGGDAHDGAYDGGALTFYGLLEGEEWSRVGLPLQAEEGLLVAFRSDTLHEVQTVARGLRFTVVSWCLGPQNTASTT